MSLKDFIHSVPTKITKFSFLLVALSLMAVGLYSSKLSAHTDPCDDNIPDARFVVSPSPKAVGELSAVFDGSNSAPCNNNAITSYQWNFGDGTTGTGVNVQHYYSVGTYFPSLTITDTAGLVNTFTPQGGVVVKASNQAPLLEDKTLEVIQGGEVAIDMAPFGSDPDGDSLAHAYSLSQDEQYGSYVITQKGIVSRASDAGQFIYRADGNASGTDTFQVKVIDGFGGETVATVTVTILTHVTAVPDTATTQEDQDVVIDVVANDESYQNQPFEIYWSRSYPESGGYIVNVNKAAGTITFHPDPGFVGTAQFEYGIKSLEPNTFRTSTTTVSVNITPAPNHAPIARNDTLVLNEDSIGSVNVFANDSDEDGDALTAAVVNGPTHGTATIDQNGTLRYTPSTNYFGADSITYQITDTEGAVSQATVAITVNSVNDAPQASFVWTKLSDGTIGFNASGSADVDNGIISYQWNFGDGTSATTSTNSTTHKYKGKTSRIVTLTVTDASGALATYSTTVTP